MLLQPLIDEYPKSRIVLGNLIVINPLHPAYVDIIDYQLFVANTIEKWSVCYLKT